MGPGGDSEKRNKFLSTERLPWSKHQSALEIGICSQLSTSGGHSKPHSARSISRPLWRCLRSLELLSEHILQLSKWYWLSMPSHSKAPSPSCRHAYYSQLQRLFLKCVWAHSYEEILQGLGGRCSEEAVYTCLPGSPPWHTCTHTDSIGREGNDDI